MQNIQTKKDSKLISVQVEIDLLEKLRIKAFEYGHGGKQLIVNEALRTYLQRDK